MVLKKRKKDLKQSQKIRKEEARLMETAIRTSKRERWFFQLFQGVSIKPTLVAKEQEDLLAKAKSEVERQLIREWRADGVSDGEICKWLKQL